jgi:hypothetical protein
VTDTTTYLYKGGKMSDFEVEPLPGIVICDAEETELPLQTFQIICIVESDPESYMSYPEDSKNRKYRMKEMLKRFKVEVDPEGSKFDKRVDSERKPTNFIWLYYDSEEYEEDINYFKKFAEASYARVNFKLWDSEDTENLKFYLQGVFSLHPDWQVAIIGSMFEDEVMTNANLSKEIGFPTTVLTRYCLSRKAFINLDDAIEYMQWTMHAEKMKRKE